MNTSIIYTEKDCGASVRIIAQCEALSVVKLCDGQSCPYRVVTHGLFSAKLEKCIIYDSIVYNTLSDALKKFTDLINEVYGIK